MSLLSAHEFARAVNTIGDTDTGLNIEEFLSSRGIGSQDHPVNCCFIKDNTQVKIHPIIHQSVDIYSSWVDSPKSSRDRLLNKNVPVIIVLATKGHPITGGHATAIIVTGNHEETRGEKAEIFGFGLLTDGAICQIMSPDPTSSTVTKINKCTVRAILPIHDDITIKLIDFINAHKTDHTDINDIPLDISYKLFATSNPGKAFTELRTGTKLNCISFLTHIMPELSANIGALQVCHTGALHAKAQCLASEDLIEFVQGFNEDSPVIREFSIAPDIGAKEQTLLQSLWSSVMPPGWGEEPLQKNKRTGKKSIKKSIKRFKNKSRRRKNK